MDPTHETMIIVVVMILTIIIIIYIYTVSPTTPEKKKINFADIQ
jgi:cytochrome oxidase Cu insertion factor (SCO1/SenC/PrrC family)